MMKQVKKSHGSRVSSRNSRAITGVTVEIRRGRSFLVTTHANPDGDALGSSLALAAGLRRLGKKVKVYNQDAVPVFLRFLPGAERVSQELLTSERFDAAFIVDCAEKDRVGEAFAKHPALGKVIVLDHHIQSRRAGDWNLIEPKAASSGVVVLRLLKKLRVPMTREIATNVYCTLVTDTGNFRYSNTDAEVLALGSELLKQGVSPWQVSKNLYESFPIAHLKLLGKVLPTLDRTPDGQIASIFITQEMFREAGATPDLAEGFINYPRSIAGVEVAVQFRETDDGKIKVSFRSKDLVDVAALAARFGGGGHQRAAGCTLQGNLSEAKEKILAAVSEALKALYKEKSA